MRHGRHVRKTKAGGVIIRSDCGAELPSYSRRELVEPQVAQHCVAISIPKPQKAYKRMGKAKIGEGIRQPARYFLLSL